jgi:hypothetical protein
MLAALANFLANIVVPLNTMGTVMQMNAESYAGLYGSQTMSSAAFNVFAGPWIQYLGGLAIGTGSFLTSLVNFLQQLKSLL